jgi:putative spermidine/putrescine transport system ATP-binding protein
VASFVGTLNVLDGLVTDSAAGSFTIDGQPVSTIRPIQQRAQDQIKIAIRPEMISTKSDSPDHNQINATVDHVTFLGAIVRIQVKMAENRLFFDTFNNPNLVPPRPGDPVTLYFPREACLVLGPKN